ncbi:pseudaminic acid cytidylyltransferase [Caballeronia glebae]|uniref:CMP-N,N'-diacetyllegionaminic acid synthase n=1 Tax=Caballeronia glebae TaxID=1777143 RepID=A0A158C567_9BURK|nr:pseudaminic acid cytidylyltransferase [Caballeronia glebae]SAK77420.1 CMP-N,N'-diacetyllegionaminic acid synthase [Caballeronia glebae]
MTTVAVIPARGGSKRIPGKNTKLFSGKPIIGWSIEAAARAECFDRIVVSTDCARIAEIACAFGAEVPFMRPVELADDHAPTISVMKHALSSLGWEAGDLACCIYATAPFLLADDLALGLETLRTSKADFAVSVTTFPYPIQRALRISAERRLAMFDPQNYLVRSQDLEETYHDAAQFYWGTAEAFVASRAILGEGTVPVEIPRHRAQDIDTPEDWIQAEAMHTALINLGMGNAHRLSC